MPVIKQVIPLYRIRKTPNSCSFKQLFKHRAKALVNVHIKENAVIAVPELLALSRTAVSRLDTEWLKKASTEHQSRRQKQLGDEGGQRKARGSVITTRYNRGEQKSISEQRNASPEIAGHEFGHRASFRQPPNSRYK